jgi:hypothetical protein
MKSYEYLDGPGQRAQRAIVEITQRKGRLKDGWPKILYLKLLFGRHAKLLVPAAFAVVSTHQSALSPRGELWRVMCKP